MKTISIQSLNDILTLVNGLSNTVSWVRDINLKEQIYVSQQYEHVWKRPTTELYNDPLSFGKTLLPEEQCPPKINSNGLSLYRIHKPDGTIGYIKDQHFYLMDNNDNHVGRMGFANEIPERMWFEMLAGLEAEDPAEKEANKNILDILKKEFKIYYASSEKFPSAQPVENLIEQFACNNAIKLTPREQVCLSYLLKGRIPKQIANEMNISIRTIEFHLDNLKRKCQCRHLLQLVSKLNGYYNE